MTRRDFMIHSTAGGAILAGSLTFTENAAAAQPADVVLSGTESLPDGFTVPAGEVWEFDPDASTEVVVQANVIVEGILRLRPSSNAVQHTLRFENVNESAFVGGHSHVPLASDVGLWVTGDGQLDIEGSRTVGWNRTGADPTWTAGAELVAAPITAGHYATNPYTGGALGSASSVAIYDNVQHIHTTETANLTRNVVIESGPGGRAHVQFLHCTQPQNVRWARFRRLGTPDKVGRYPFHVHMCGDGVRGSTFYGLVIDDSGNQGFVPHLSNGCYFFQCVAHDIDGMGFWWDGNEQSADTTWDQCLALGCTGVGFMLGEGSGNRCVGSAAAGNKQGFRWPEGANNDPNRWQFERNVAHNNTQHGIAVWQNDSSPHVIATSTAYRNGIAGFDHGAYANAYTYFECVGFQNGEADLSVHAVAAGVIGSRFVNCFIEELRLTKHRNAGTATTLFYMGRKWPIRHITVTEADDGGSRGGVYHFYAAYRANELRADHFDLQSVLSAVTVENPFYYPDLEFGPS